MTESKYNWMNDPGYKKMSCTAINKNRCWKSCTRDRGALSLLIGPDSYVTLLMRLECPVGLLLVDPITCILTIVNRAS